MDVKRYRGRLAGFIVLMILAGCAGGESFKQGQELAKDKRWNEAILYFEKAVSENPDSEEYKNHLAMAKQEVARANYEKAKQALASQPNANLPALEQIAKEMNLASVLDPQNKEIKASCNSLKEKISTLQARVKTLYSQAETDMQKEDWMTALVKLREVNTIYPSYEDTGSRLGRAEQEFTKMSYQQGVAFAKVEDWRLATQAFKAAMDINPQYFDVARLYQNAKARDNAEYFLGQAEKAQKAQNWERAILMLEKAGEYQPGNQAVMKNLEDLKVKVGRIYFDDALKLANQGALIQAFKKLTLAKTYIPSLQDDHLYREFIGRYCGQMMEKAEKYSEREMWGNALLWYQKVEGLNPNYLDLFQKLLEIKDHINKRIKKSIAVFDFGSPSNDKDAGKIAANKLITFLHRNASGDLRIIERENLQSILREMQLGQTGLVDMKAAQSVGKMRGIDTFIMGDVLHFSAKTTDNPSTSQVKVLVDEEDVSNPEFSSWLILNPKPMAEELQNAPPRTVKKRNYQFVSYKRGNAKISSMIEISYKLVDTMTGENIFTNTISGKMIKEDDYQDGVPLANIAHDPLQLPTEMEVLDELTNAKIGEVGQSVLKNYQSLEVEYFNQGQMQQKRRNNELAIEKYMDAVFDEKLKGISTPITQKSLELIEAIVQDK
ncbi:MAG: hypothetical protein HY742_04720 [Deltaproteobacteria bacterium]|nr:hypothetical protein [Deltaproteobacteria bacterium]